MFLHVLGIRAYLANSRFFRVDSAYYFIKKFFRQIFEKFLVSYLLSRLQNESIFIYFYYPVTT